MVHWIVVGWMVEQYFRGLGMNIFVVNFLVVWQLDGCLSEASERSLESHRDINIATSFRASL